MNEMVLYTLTAICLLDSNTKVSADEIRFLRPYIYAVAQQMEIMDKDEPRVFMADKFSRSDTLLRYEFELLRSRKKEYNSYPKTIDIKLFCVNKSLLDDWCEANRSFRQQLSFYWSMLHRQEYEDAMAETDELFKQLECLREAVTPFYFVTVKRNALRRYREMIGPAAYYSGYVPSCVPTSRLPVYRR